jgi:hypothetical protein
LLTLAMGRPAFGMPLSRAMGLRPHTSTSMTASNPMVS